MAVAAAAGLSAVGASAHHSPFLFYDPASSIELAGRIVDVQWRNPHVVFEIESGVDVWHVEANSVSILKRMNLTPDAVRPGDRVRVAGWRSIRGGNELFVINMLLTDGNEIVFMPGESPRWSDNVADPAGWLLTEADLTDADGDTDIFHVWSTTLGSGPAAVLLFDGVEFPLTDDAAAERAGYDLFSNPIFSAGCVHKGMPTIMEQPYPMELIDEGDRIVMRMEEGDAVREIDMTPAGSAAARDASPMGHSYGRWEDGVLVVTTTGSNWPYVDMTGVRNSVDTEMVERFTLSDDGRRLDYSITLTDPETFTTPVTLGKFWLRVPGETVTPYECEE